MENVNIDLSLVQDLEELSLECSITVQKSDEELERLTVDEHLSPIERSVYLLSSGQPVQQISVITALPDLLKENNADCMRRVVPKVREVLHVAQQDMQLAACNSFLQILQQQLLPVNNYTQTFLQTIITSLDSRDQDIARAWLDTLLDVIDLLPKDVIKKDILTVAITKGQLSQSVQSRLSCCQILGKIATKFEPFVIKKDILPIVQSLCQDVDYEVRACMCRQLDPVARGLGLEQTKSAILPELVELTNDEESHVRLAGLETVVKILSLLDNDTCINTIIPLVCKFCQQAMNKEDVTLPFVAKQLGKLCHQLQSNLTDEQKKWFVDFFKKLCRLGVKEADRPYNRDPEDIPQGPKFPTGFFQQTSEIDDDDSTVGTRKHAAFNFPSMVLFVGSKSFKSELYSSFGSLCTDPSYIVRKSVAMGIHEVVKSLGNSCFLLINELNQLFKDDSIEVLQGLTVHIAETLETIAKCVNSTTTNAETKQNAFQDLIPSMLQCEAVVASSNNWRLQAAFLDALKCLPSCYHSDLIYQKFAPLLFKKLLYARALPVKHAAGRTLLVLMRHNRRLEQRQEVCTRLVEELCHGRSCYQRCLFIDLCTMIMEDFSRAFFKEYFFEFLLELCSDRVPNVRLKICSMFPRLKKQIKLPADRQLLQLLETCVRKLLMSENDKDVKDVLDKSVKEFDRVQIHVSSKHQSQEEEQLDRKKEEEEKRLIELEEKEKEEESAKAEKKSAEKKKEPSGSKSNSSSKVTSSGNRRGSKAPPATSLTPKEKAINSGGVRTERSGSFAGPSSANNSDKKSPSSRSTAASTKSSGRTSSTNSPKLLTPSSATSSTNSRKGSASSVSSSSSISSTGSRRSSTGSTPNQDEKEFRNLVLWLEDHKIRHYKIEDRQGLRNVDTPEWTGHMKRYLEDINCPLEDSVERNTLIDWILGYAVRLDYGDNVDQYKAVSANVPGEKGPNISSNPLDTLDFESADFKAGVASLAQMLQIPPHQDHLTVLKAITILVKERLNKETIERVKKVGIKPSDKIPLEKVELGFETSASCYHIHKEVMRAAFTSCGKPCGIASLAEDYISTEAAKILRLLHIRELRDLQTFSNQAIVAVQTLTANPKTDTKLGKVGKG